MKLKLVGYQYRYDGWPKNHWDFSHEHIGPLPEGHASRRIRKVYIDESEGHERQVYVRTKPKPFCPYDDPSF